MFMAMVMGGFWTFSADQIDELHQPLGIADEDFEEMIRLLERSLAIFEVDPDEVATS